MARLARSVIPGIPYLVTLRGNRRGEVFFSVEDRRNYLSELGGAALHFHIKIQGWCLMGNHVHLLVVPGAEDALARTIELAHACHTRWVNDPRGWTGPLWASRFFSAPLDAPHLWVAIRYVELNPVRAGLAARAEDWPWSSARAHVLGTPDPLLDPERPFAAGARDALTGAPLPWGDWLARGLPDEEAAALREATRTGRPCGDAAFVEDMELKLICTRAPQKPAPKPREAQEDEFPGFFEG